MVSSTLVTTKTTPPLSLPHRPRGSSSSRSLRFVALLGGLALVYLATTVILHRSFKNEQDAKLQHDEHPFLRASSSEGASFSIIYNDQEFQWAQTKEALTNMSSDLLARLTRHEAAAFANNTNNTSPACWNLVRDFGADPTGDRLANPALEEALRRVATYRQQQTRANNGQQPRQLHVVITIPAGLYRLHPVEIVGMSDLTLRWEPGAVWQAAADADCILAGRYPLHPAMPAYGGGVEDGKPKRYAPFVSLLHCRNVHLMGGRGARLVGGGPVWWKLWKEGKLSYTRPYLLFVGYSRDIVIEGLTLTISPFWSLHVYDSARMLIQNVSVTNPKWDYYYPDKNNPKKKQKIGASNCDGINLSCCVAVVVRDCHVNTEDDAITIKSGRDRAGMLLDKPSRDILVDRVTARSERAAALAVGSELSGGVRRVVFSNIDVHHSKYGVRIKTGRGRGAVVQDLHFSNLTVQVMRHAAVELTMFRAVKRPSLRIRSGFWYFDFTKIRNIVFDTVEFVVEHNDRHGAIPAEIHIDGEYSPWIHNITFSKVRSVLALNNDRGNNNNNETNSSSIITLDCVNADGVILNDVPIKCRVDPWAFWRIIVGWIVRIFNR